MKEQMHLINKNSIIKDAIKRIGQITFPSPLVLFVVDDREKIVGSITDGDIRRGFLAGKNIENSIVDIMNKDFHYIKKLIILFVH